MFCFYFLALLVVAYANVVKEGPCPGLKAIENFDVEAYSGLWYEIAKYPSESENPDGNCATAEYTLKGDIVIVNNSYVLNGVQTYIEGTARLADDANGAAELIVTFTFGDIVSESPLSVLASDYESYAVAYRCKFYEESNNHRVYAWIVSRTPTLEGDAKTAVDSYLADNSDEFDTSQFVYTYFSEEACSFIGSSAITDQPPEQVPDILN